ncbi:AsmA-like C-terminal region-containing protein [Chryseosolibacter indicus]|uniref:AsmA family protein n=1 Tax=Chryseosolibacter indicus TaxID=2782351 RepID=A0ABS5VTI4_9BACT|nr:AsmA-like C-terminal region-containing protein [Chryseosolibacter indicus]MBT1704730.1 hypothetical protein [Chryseosolibacter indicus]
MQPKIKKWVIRPLLILLISISVCLGIGFLILTTQQQRLVNMALQQLNKEFKGELSVEKSNISLFKNFPYISIGLHNTRFLPDKTGKGAPIYKFDRIYVGFSLPDLFQQKYNIRRLFIQGGYVNLVQEADGTINLLSAKNFQSDTIQTSSTDSSAFGTIDLQKAIFKNVNISYLDKASGRKLGTHIDKLTSSFKMDSSLLTLSISSNMELDVTTNTDSAFFRHKKFWLDAQADYRLEDKLFEIRKCNFKLEDAAFKVAGTADLSERKKLDLKINGEKQDFDLVTAFLPDDVKETLKPFRYDGRIYFDATIKGNIAEEQLPLIEVSFGCEDAWFLNTDAKKKVDKLGFKGYYTNGAEHSLQTSELRMINITARPEKGIFKGNFVVRDFTKPRTLVQIKSELELKFLGEFLGIHDLKQLNGKIKLDMDFKELNDIKLPEESLNKLKEGIQSKLIVEDLSFHIPGYPHPVEDMNIRAEMKNGRITLDTASLRIGNSDLTLSGSLSDIKAFLRHPERTVTLTLNASSKQLILSELLVYDTALAAKVKEEVRGFNVGLSLETSVQQLLHPSPLPKGKFEMRNLRASFKRYPHVLEDLGATVLIEDTTLRLRNFIGKIDSSDIQFSGRVNNYALWFRDVKKGKTQIAFDFKSNRFALKDVLGPISRKYIPRGYRREEASNVWLRAKVDLRYDTVFRFAKAKIANVTADLKKHNLKLKDIRGNIKYGARVLILDTLKGSIGRSDFDVSLKYFTGLDRQQKKRTNSLVFRSNFLDADELSSYDLAPAQRRSRRDSATAVASKVDTSKQHAEAFNIFKIPFSDFTWAIDIGKLKYNRLWLKDVTAKARMQEDHQIFIDTLSMKVADGAVSMRGHLNGDNPERIYFRSRINIDQVDLEKMMLKLDHFGQDVVINKNIKGRLTGQIRSYVQIHPDFVPIMNNTKAELNVKVYNGSLVDFAPMQAMAGYFKDKNLRLIRFDTLQNRLTFSNGVLDIPAMNINSSLGYIQLSGKQSLDMSMEYYVRVPMKMVTKVGLSALFNRKHEEVDIHQVDEIEYIDAEKKIAFMNLKVTGKPDDFQVGLGKDKGRKQ